MSVKTCQWQFNDIVSAKVINSAEQPWNIILHHRFNSRNYAATAAAAQLHI